MKKVLFTMRSHWLSTNMFTTMPSVGKRGEWVSLGQAFFADDKDGVTVVAAEHEYHPVFVAVEYKPGPTWPLLSDHSQHFNPILPVK
jgi:hypothetical protein